MSGRLQAYEGQLAEGIAALGLALPQETVDRLLAFGELLLKWNKVYNLTAIRNPQEVITHHLLDSLAVLPHLGAVNRLADIGSGGGLPGVVLAIVHPGLIVTSIETVGKKASFQQQAKIELGLGNFGVLNKRLLQPGGLREPVRPPRCGGWRTVRDEGRQSGRRGCCLARRLDRDGDPCADRAGAGRGASSARHPSRVTLRGGDDVRHSG